MLNFRSEIMLVFNYTLLYSMVIDEIKVEWTPFAGAKRIDKNLIMKSIEFLGQHTARQMNA